jgi:hypothetical protein
LKPAFRKGGAQGGRARAFFEIGLSCSVGGRGCGWQLAES